MTFLLSHPGAPTWLSIVLQLSFPVVVTLITLILCRIFYKLNWPWATKMGQFAFLGSFMVLVFWLTVTIGASVGQLFR